MKLTNLKPLHLDISKNHMTFDVFEYTHNGKVTFSTNNFFEEFNANIPHAISKKTISPSTLSKIYECEEGDKIYFDDIRCWNKYPLLKKNVTPKNREKTRLLYPKIYEDIKDKNISVFYTDKNLGITAVDLLNRVKNL